MERYGKKEAVGLSRMDEFLLSTQLTRSSPLARLGAFAFSGMFFAGGAAMLFITTLKPVATFLDARDWERTAGLITHSELVRDGESHGPLIRYTYSSRGAAHEGTRISWSETKRNFGIREMRDIIARHPVGKEITVWHDPENPSDSVIHRSQIGLRPETLLFPIPFLLVGVCGISYALLGGLAAARTRKLNATVAGQAESAGLGSLARRLRQPSRTEDTSEKIVFTMVQSRTEGLAILFAAVFWNGIVGVFLGVLVTMIISGEKMAVFLGLFLIPFVAIGALLIYLAARQFTAPRPTAYAIAFSGMAHTRSALEITVEWMKMRNARNPPGASDPLLHLERGADRLASRRKQRTSPYGQNTGGLRLVGDHGTGTIRLEAADAKAPSDETEIEAVFAWRDGRGSGEKHVTWAILQNNDS